MAAQHDIYFERVHPNDDLEGYAQLAGANALDTLRGCDPARLLAVGGRRLWAATSWPVCYGAVELDGPRGAWLSRIIVDPSYRRQGVATLLLTELEERLRERRATALSVHYPVDAPYRYALEGLLAAHQWEPSHPLFRIVRIPCARIVGARWLREAERWSRREVFPWSELSAAERLEVELLAGESADGFLSPFQSERTIDPVVSHGARSDGKVVGWVITHRVAEDIVRFSVLYLRPHVRGRILAMAMLAAAIRSACGIYREAIFLYRVDNQPMNSLVDRTLAPFVSSCREYLSSTKWLGSGRAGGDVQINVARQHALSPAR
jgi:ribosomal protein S18 acetylase RimI-like enzyme